MRRYKPYSRRELRARLRAWIARNKRLTTTMVLGLVVLLAFETVIILRFLPAEPWRWYLLGALHVGLCAAFAGLMGAAFLAHDREAILQMRGAWGEENTRDELARARRRRLIWGWVDSLTLEYGDIDHLVVTRAAGLVAIDSKFRTAAGPADWQAMARDAHKSRLRAEAVIRTELRRERGSHRDTAIAHRVTPLLVIWGPVQHSVPPGATVDGIEVVGGRRLLAWLRRQQGDAVDRAAGRDVVAKLERFRANAWTATGPHRP